MKMEHIGVSNGTPIGGLVDVYLYGESGCYGMECCNVGEWKEWEGMKDIAEIKETLLNEYGIEIIL